MGFILKFVSVAGMIGSIISAASLPEEFGGLKVIIAIFGCISCIPLYVLGGLYNRVSDLEDGMNEVYDRVVNKGNKKGKVKRTSEGVEVICKKCGEKLFFEGTEENAQCPYCDCKIEFYS